MIAERRTRCAHITRICTVEVCERRSRAVRKIKCVLLVPCTGWSGGVLSASKQCHSVSMSGPSAIENPIRRKHFTARSMSWVSGCSVPGEAYVPGSARIESGQRGGVRPRIEGGGAGVERGGDRLPELVQQPAETRAILLATWCMPSLSGCDLAALRPGIAPGRPRARGDRRRTSFPQGLLRRIRFGRLP